MITIIKLSDGTEKRFITNENDYYKFYMCDTFGEAQSLVMVLTERGEQCEIADCRRGWYVRVKKNYRHDTQGNI